MGREERKLKKHLEQSEITERRKRAQKEKAFKGKGQEPVDPAAVLLEGQVIQISANSCLVRADGSDLRCQHLVEVAVGDRVMFSLERSRVERVLPRRTALSRPDPHNPRIERVLAANIDLVVNVVSLHSPPLSLGLIDRYLIAIEQSGADPLVCVNKVDLLSAVDHSLQTLQPYIDLGVPVIHCSAATGQGMEELRSAISNKLCVFTGHSGVGKSSLLNALSSECEAATGGVSVAYGKGRHTTTSSRLYELPNGAVIIDTPGIRELGLWNVSPKEIHRYFHEFDELARACPFSDCTHTHEPRCAVKEAVQTGEIASARYGSYLRIMAS